jgi:pilus assembly protein CpaE
MANWSNDESPFFTGSFSDGEPAVNLNLVTDIADLTVAVIDSDQKLRTRLASQLGTGERAGAFPSLADLEEKLPPSTAIVVVLGPSLAHDAGLQEIQRLSRSRPEIGAILVVEELTTDMLQRALRAGVRDVLTTTAEADQLAEAVSRVSASLVVTPVQPQRPIEPQGGDGNTGRVITVFSTKGGAGKSMLATNLAIMLARRSEKPVVLVDADLQFGDIAVMLKLAPQHTIVDVVASIDRLDPSLLKSLLIKHEASGLFVLPAPLEPAFADQVGTPQMQKIIQMLQTFCDFVVVDTPAYFNEVVLGLIEGSDDILLVAGMDIPNIKNVKIGLQTLRLLNTPLSKLKLVLNRANSKVKLDVSEVERTLQIKADCLIPSDIAVPQSVNKGTPVVLDAPKSGVAKSIEQLADLFLVDVDAKRRRR